MKGAKQVLSYHNQGLRSALCDLFPDIGLIKYKFWPCKIFFFFSRLFTYTTAWSDPQSRRRFFEDYAKENKFDPLIPSNWYSNDRKKILSTKVFYFYFIL